MRLYELNNKSIMVIFAYSNPPSVEYDTYYKELLRKARNTDHIVFLNPFVDSVSNPLSFVDNLSFNKKIFPNINFSDKQCKNVTEILKELSDQYNEIVFLTKRKDIAEYRRFELDASKYGFIRFSVEQLPNTKDANSLARKAVQDNDYNEFVKHIPSNSKHLTSKLFLTMRKASALNESIKRKATVNMAVRSVIDDIYDDVSGVNILSAKLTKDIFNNKVYESKNHDIKVVEVSHLSEPKVGVFKQDNSKCLFVPSLTESYITDNYRKLNSLLETTTSANIASSTSLFGGDFINTRETPPSYNTAKTDPLLSKLIQDYISKHGYIDSEIINKLRKKLK